MSDFIETNTNDDGIDRRGFLKCMAWAGTGVIWSINGGLLTSTVLGQEANNRSAIATAELSFVQISDSHIGFNKPANTDVVGTTREAIMRINALPKVPEFLLHTGDLTHLSDPTQFDTLAQVLKDCRTKDVFYVPGEHDIYDGGAQYRERFGKNTTGTGWYSFDQKGVHFIGLVNVANIQEGGLGTLGQQQLEWLEKDVKGLSPSTPIVLFAHIPLWAVYPKWGWGNRRCRASTLLCEAFRVSDRFKRAHSPGHAEGGRQHHFPHRQGHSLPVTNTGFSAQTASSGRRSPSTQENAGTNQR
jgi:Icc protein